MSKRGRRAKRHGQDRPVTRREALRIVSRARQDIIRAVVVAASVRPEALEPLVEHATAIPQAKEGGAAPRHLHGVMGEAPVWGEASSDDPLPLPTQGRLHLRG
jgi:hypothetical protein